MTPQLKILDYALSSLVRRKYKSLALVAVYSFIVATLASVLFLTQSLRNEATTVLQTAPELVIQRLLAGRHELIPNAYRHTIEQIPGVGKVTPRVWGYYYDSLYKANFTLLAIQEPAQQLQLLQGRLPQASAECAIGSGVAKLFGVSLGDSLVLVDQRNESLLFEVTGLFQTDSNLLTNDLILLSEAQLRNFFAIPAGQATDLSVEVFNPREIATIAKKIKLALPDTRPISRTEILHTYDTVFSWRSGMLLTVFLAALVAFCILAWDKATGLSAEEKREIGILKAIGWGTDDVLLLKFWEGLVVSLSAFLLGISLAYLHIFHSGAAILLPVLKGWSVLFPAFDLTPAIDLYQLFVLATLTVVPYLACTIIPAWKSSVTDPDSVMRS